jgi:hypothetical protein
MKQTPRITREQLVEMLHELGDEAAKTAGLEGCASAIAFAANAISERLDGEVDMPTMTMFVEVLVRKDARKWATGLDRKAARERAVKARLN